MNNKIYILFLFIIFFIPFVFKNKKQNIENFSQNFVDSCKLDENVVNCPSANNAYNTKVPGTSRTCASWSQYNTTYQQRQMGLPSNVPVVYPAHNYWTGKECVQEYTYNELFKNKKCCNKKPPIENYRKFTFYSNLSGANGPTQAQVDQMYEYTSLENQVTINTQGVQEWSVPVKGTYKISAIGTGTLSGDFELKKGTIIKVVVGQKGKENHNRYNQKISGGCGGTFVYIDGQPEPLVVAGGAGGIGNGIGTTSLTEDPTMQYNYPNVSGSELWYQGCNTKDFNLGGIKNNTIQIGYGGYSTRGGGGAGWKGNGCNFPLVGGSSKPSWKGGTNTKFAEGGFGGGGAAWNAGETDYYGSRAYSGGGGGYSGGPGALGNVYGFTWYPGSGGSYIDKDKAKNIIKTGDYRRENGKVEIELISSTDADSGLRGKIAKSYYSISELETLIYDNRFANPSILQPFKARLQVLKDNKSRLETAVEEETCGLGVKPNSFIASESVKTAEYNKLIAKQIVCLNKAVDDAIKKNSNESYTDIDNAFQKYPLAKDDQTIIDKAKKFIETKLLRDIVANARQNNEMGIIAGALKQYPNADAAAREDAKKVQTEIQTKLLQNKISFVNSETGDNKLGVLTPALDLYTKASYDKRIEAEDLRQQLQTNKLNQLVTEAETNNSAILTQALKEYKYANKSSKETAKNARIIVHTHLLNEVTNKATTTIQIQNGLDAYDFANQNAKDRANRKKERLRQTTKLNQISQNALGDMTYGEITPALNTYSEAYEESIVNAMANRVIIQSVKIVEEATNINDINSLNNLIDNKYQYADKDSKEIVRDKIKVLELIRDQSQSLTTEANRAKTTEEIDALFEKYTEASKEAVDSALKRRNLIIKQTNNVLQVAASATTSEEISEVKRDIYYSLASQKAKDLLNARYNQILSDTLNLSNILLSGEYQALEDGLKDYPLATKDIRDKVKDKIEQIEEDNEIKQKQNNDEELNNIANSSLSVSEIDKAIRIYQPASESAVAAAKARKQEIENQTTNIENRLSSAVTLDQLKTLRDSNPLASSEAKESVTKKEEKMGKQITSFQGIVNTGTIQEIQRALNSELFSLVPTQNRINAEKAIQDLRIAAEEAAMQAKIIAEEEAAAAERRRLENERKQRMIAEEEARATSVTTRQPTFAPSVTTITQEEMRRQPTLSELSPITEEQLIPTSSKGYSMGEELPDIRPGFPIPQECNVTDGTCVTNGDKLFSIEEEMRRGPSSYMPSIPNNYNGIMQEEVKSITSVPTKYKRIVQEETGMKANVIDEEITINKGTRRIVDDEMKLRKGGNIINNNFKPTINVGTTATTKQEKPKQKITKKEKQEQAGIMNVTNRTRRPVNINVRYNNNRPMSINDYGDNNMDVSRYIFDKGFN